MYVSKTVNSIFQLEKGVYFVQISPFLYIVCLLIFSILQIFNGRFLVKL